LGGGDPGRIGGEATRPFSISGAGINIEGARVTTTTDQKAVHSSDLSITDVASVNAVMKRIERIRS